MQSPHCSDFAATHCQDFTPALKFKPPLRGFSEEFNSFRIGKAWAKRIITGSMVALVNSKTSEIFGYGKVQQVYCGNKEELANLYGKDNHTIKYLEITDNIAFSMLKRLRNASGAMIYNSSDFVTVIYMGLISVN